MGSRSTRAGSTPNAEAHGGPAGPAGQRRSRWRVGFAISAAGAIALAVAAWYFASEPTELYLGLPRLEGTLPPLPPSSLEPLAALRRPEPGMLAEAPALVPLEADAPVVALVIVELGLATAPLLAAAALPTPVALALSPYADPAAPWWPLLAGSGRELLLELPIARGQLPADLGPLMLDPGLDEPALRARLAMMLDQPALGSIVAIAGGFARDPERFRPLAQMIEAAGRSLLELEGEALASAVQEPIAATDEQDLDQPDPRPAYRGHVRALDAVLGAEAIDAALAALAAEARSTGSAIGYLRPFPLSIARVERWLPELAGAGIRLVPPSVALARRG